jgi:phage shock protein PspC (stress-responsive transcriptional regulator)
MHDRLYRSRDDVVIGGVAGGVAKALDLDPSIVRVVWVLLAFLTGGVAGLVYLVMLIVVPQEPLTPQAFGAQPLGSAGGIAASTPGAQPAAEAGAFGGEPAVPGAEPGSGWSESAAPLAAAAVPSRSEARAARRARRDAGGALVFGVILILVGGYFLIREYVPQLDTDVVWPIVVIAVGLLLLLGALRPRAHTDG